VTRSELLLVTGSALLFAWMTAVAVGGGIWFDAPLRDALRAIATPSLTEAMRGLTLLGGDKIVLPLMALAAWRLAAAGRRREALLLAAIVVGLDILVNLLKPLVGRTRPAALYGYPLPSTASFPSGHAALALGLYGAAAVHGGMPQRVLAGTLVALVGLSRIYLGVHYPSDVIGGYALAALWIATARVCARKLA
jgi:undecaprenyl-diphosphatase